MAEDFYRQLGTGVASLTFGVALSIFIYAVASGIVHNLQTLLLFGTSFLLMMRFWWRYNELFVKHMPSRTFWHFLFDFAISFFGILSVIFVSAIQVWAMLGVLAMLSSAIRCGLSWHNAKGEGKIKLRRTYMGAVLMLVIMLLVYVSATVVDIMALSASVFILVLLFVVYSTKKP